MKEYVLLGSGVMVAFACIAVLEMIENRRERHGESENDFVVTRGH